MAPSHIPLRTRCHTWRVARCLSGVSSTRQIYVQQRGPRPEASWGIKAAPEIPPKEGAAQDNAERQAVHSFQESIHVVLGRRGWIIGKHEAALGPVRVDGKDHPLHDVAAWCECLWETH